jgi:Na+-driven multidrug efflux pump
MPASVEEIEGPFDGFNLSDVFEYMSRPDHERVYAALLESARPRGLGAGLGLWVLGRANHPLRLGYQAPFASREQLRGLLSIGLPNALQMLVRAVTVIGLTGLVGSLAGTPALDALGVCTRLDTVLLFGTAGFGAAATVAVGQALGAGDSARALRAARATATWAVATAVMVVLAIAWSAVLLLRGMVPAASEPISYQNYVELGTSYLRIAAWAHPFGAVALAVTGAVNGAGVAVPPLVLDLLVYGCLLCPVALLMGSVGTGLELRFLWGVVVGAHVVLAAAYLWFLERGQWLPGRSPEA